MINQGEIITLSNDNEYLCFDTTEMDGKHYIYLITTKEPTEVCFAEQAMVDGELDICLIGERKVKMKLASILQQKAQEVDAGF